MRSLSKLHLNTLYGIFGRETDILKSIILPKNEELDIVSKYCVKGIMNVTDRLPLYLINSNVDFKLIKDTNTKLGIDLWLPPTQIVKSNVAIASAITAIARIEMMKYKMLEGIQVLYTDTDSIFTE